MNFNSEFAWNALGAAMELGFGAALMFGHDIWERRRRDRCRYGVDAEVVHMRHDEGSTANGGNRCTAWVTWKYPYHGREYQATSSNSITVGRREIGYHERILIDPERPGHIYVPQAVNRRMWAVAKLMGAAILANGVYYAFLLAAGHFS